MKIFTNTIRPYRGFTLIELLIAGILLSFVMTTVTLAMSQLAKTKKISQERLLAYSRADSALESLRRDVISVLRRDDLFFSRFLITNSEPLETEAGFYSQDELLLFTSDLRAIKSVDYNGEGVEHEVQWRIENENNSPILWRRRDAVLDQYPLAGGVATPMIQYIIGLEIEAYDGEFWQETWDSDELGIPHAVKITVWASSAQNDKEIGSSVIAPLQTVVPIDRVEPPDDLFIIQEQDSEESELSEEIESEANTEEVSDPSQNPTTVIPGNNTGGGNAVGGGNPGGVSTNPSTPTTPGGKNPLGNNKPSGPGSVSGGRNQ